MKRFDAIQLALKVINKADKHYLETDDFKKSFLVKTMSDGISIYYSLHLGFWLIEPNGCMIRNLDIAQMLVDDSWL